VSDHGAPAGGREKIAGEQAPGGPGALVRDVMLRRPKTLPAGARVEEARAALANDHVHLVLLTDGGTLVGTLTRTDLPAQVPGSGPALPWSTLRDRTVAATAPADAVPAILAARGLRRLAVVDDDGTLLGLLCLKRRRTGFCSDRDVESRARDPLAQAGSGVSAPVPGSASARSPMSARRSRSETS
jgi:CBS domain-containing protein